KIIDKRLNSVTTFIKEKDIRVKIIELLKPLLDIERLISKISLSRANPKDLLGLSFSLKDIAAAGEILQGQYAFKPFISDLADCTEIISLIDDAVNEDSSILIREGNIIKKGYNSELDELIDIRENGKDWILKFQEREKGKYSINTLKVRYNRVFGYYIEIPRTQSDKVPEHYLRKQTLANAERYTVPELQEFEEKILSARDKSDLLEYTLFMELLKKITEKNRKIQQNSSVIASIDVLISLAVTAEEKNYCRPEFTEEDTLLIEGSRHPVIEDNLKDEEFIINDCKMDIENRIFIITGPNMAGKSTYIRQVALITLLAQIGSFVPAAKAEMPLFDRIFTRVGASDNLTRGE
ncbi:MAG: DNA mismatch repair protein MutS, partial [Actinomycetia bacterium]|nr:DNA mismatch repair protein MutS [Actinomycetes bacterium]